MNGIDRVIVAVMKQTLAWASLVSTFVLTSCATHTAYAPRPPQTDLEHKTRTEQEYIAFDARYPEEKAQRIAQARALYAKVSEREAAGQITSCSKEILWEFKALITQSANFKLLDQRLADLEASLAHPELEAGAGEQIADRWQLGPVLRRMVLQTRRAL